MRKVQVAVALAMTSFAALPVAKAQCLVGGDVNICEDPITGASAGATVTGGTLLPGVGLRIDAKGDAVVYDLGTYVKSGAM